jgi:hypothetical protein
VRLAGQAQIARLTFEYLRPVPMAPLILTTCVESDGAKVQRLAGSLLARMVSR